MPIIPETEEENLEFKGILSHASKFKDSLGYIQFCSSQSNKAKTKDRFTLFLVKLNFKLGYLNFRIRDCTPLVGDFCSHRPSLLMSCGVLIFLRSRVPSACLWLAYMFT